MNPALVWLCLKDSFSCSGWTLVEATMKNAAVQIILLGLSLVLVTALPNKVRSLNLKVRAPYLKETKFIEYIYILPLINS